MLQGLLMASGSITLYILYGKNADKSKFNNIRAIGYSLLNMLWLITLFCSFDSGSGLATQIACIVLTIAYPAIIIICGIRNRKRNNKKED